MKFVDTVRKYQQEMSFPEAVEKAIDECIKNGILAEFLRKNRAEVLRVSIFEYDEEEHMRQEREESSWLVDGLLPISEFKDFLDLDELPLEEKTGFNTVAGFVVTNIGHIPTAGNYFLWNGYRFEVVDMDGTRIDKILVEKLPEAEAAETDAKDQ